MIDDWDDAYANAKYIPDGASYPDRWTADAAAFRAEMIAGGRLDADIEYGPGPRNRLDMFLPDGPAKGLAVFVHGGFWQAFDKSTWSHFARGAVENGWAAALPSYTLAPTARLTAMTQEIGAAVETLAARVEGPIRLAGHSAGGHLVTRMMCSDSPLSPDTRARLSHVLSISGLHDLRPLTLAPKMNGVLKIDAAEARAESAALCDPLPTIALTAWVGAAERPEFIRQSELLANVWAGCAVETRLVIEPDLHHFNIVAGLADRDSPITRAFVGADGWPDDGTRVS